MNTGSITDVLSGNKPVGVEIKIETKSLIILGTVIVIAALAIITFRKIAS